MSIQNERKKYNLKTWLIPKLRRLSYQWMPRKEAQRAARIERGKYKCAICSGIFGPKEISLDHIHPVIKPETGFIGWEEYISRLFCDYNGFQVLCDPCHDAKTAEEDIERKKLTLKSKPDIINKKSRKKRKK